MNTKQKTFGDYGIKVKECRKSVRTPKDPITRQASFPKTKEELIRDMNAKYRWVGPASERDNLLLALGLAPGSVTVIKYQGHWYCKGDVPHCTLFAIIHNFRVVKEMLVKYRRKCAIKAYNSDMWFYGNLKHEFARMVWECAQYGETLYNCDDEYNLVEAEMPPVERPW